MPITKSRLKIEGLLNWEWGRKKLAQITFPGME
jgi:hypothetical protein